MHLKSFVVRNFRRLKKVTVDLSDETTIFVGANNSGKTSATHIFQLLLGENSKFSIHDFSADNWEIFSKFDPDATVAPKLPTISMDLWFDVDEDNLHRVIDLLPDLDWQGKPVGVRLAFEAKDEVTLYANYREARQASTSVTDHNTGSDKTKDTYEPWPKNFYDYLSKRLNTEYQVRYYKLDADHFDDNLTSSADYEPPILNGGAGIVKSIIHVDFLDAQRHLSDSESHGGEEDLSRRLTRFYIRNLDKREPDLKALRALAESESRLNDHFADVFSPTLKSLSAIGYHRGLGRPELMVRTDLRADSLLSGSAQVHYAVAGVVPDIDNGVSITLPEKYNGLGFKNLIYMAVEILGFHYAWQESEDTRPPVHVIMIEEPESHLHVQLQQVFVRKIQELVKEVVGTFKTQFVLTTHSSHILYEDFRFIRYFSRVEQKDKFQYTKVKNLSKFWDTEESETRQFLLQYLKLTHCDLFFADAAILVEGNVERLLLPLIINRSCGQLETCHLTILEVGGAFSHKFKKLIEFLGLTCLIITDLDSVKAPENYEVDAEDPGTATAKRPHACSANTLGATTANETLKQWIPELTSVEKLLDLDSSLKTRGPGELFTASVRVAYQINQQVTWNGESREIAGRTFEEAFVFENLKWTQDELNSALGLRLRPSVDKDNLDDVIKKTFARIRNLDKTKFALALISADHTWAPPSYIVEGLHWLARQLDVADRLHSSTHSNGHSK